MDKHRQTRQTSEQTNSKQTSRRTKHTDKRKTGLSLQAKPKPQRRRKEQGSARTTTETTNKQAEGGRRRTSVGGGSLRRTERASAFIYIEPRRTNTVVQPIQKKYKVHLCKRNGSIRRKYTYIKRTQQRPPVKRAQNNKYTQAAAAACVALHCSGTGIISQVSQVNQSIDQPIPSCYSCAGREKEAKSESPRNDHNIRVQTSVGGGGRWAGTNV